jgi:hypothetical protein
MDYKLTLKYQHAKRDKKGKCRDYYLYFLNDVLILKQKVPFNENWDSGWQHHTRLQDTHLLNGRIHQIRKTSMPGAWWRGSQHFEDKVREVKFPISKKILEQFNIPKDLKISL